MKYKENIFPVFVISGTNRNELHRALFLLFFLGYKPCGLTELERLDGKLNAISAYSDGTIGLYHFSSVKEVAFPRKVFNAKNLNGINKYFLEQQSF